MSTNLTAADLAVIEARWAAVGRRVPGGPDPAYEAMPDPRPDIAALLTSLEEARALAEALYNVGEYYHYHGDHLEGQIAVCWQCGATDGHAVGCWVGKAETALAAWKGGGDE